MRFILINKGQETAFRKVKLAWHTGIDAIEIADGNFVLPERVLPIIRDFPKPNLYDALKNRPIVEDPKFIEWDEDGNRIN
jgi:hypothetical protein